MISVTATSGHSQPAELFNVRADVAERRNQFAEHPEIVRELKALLEQYKRDGRSTPGEPQRNDAPLESASPARKTPQGTK